MSSASSNHTMPSTASAKAAAEGGEAAAPREDVRGAQEGGRRREGVCLLYCVMLDYMYSI